MLSPGDESDSSGCLGLLFAAEESDSEAEELVLPKDLVEIPVVMLGLGEDFSGQNVRLGAATAREAGGNEQGTALLSTVTMSGFGTSIELRQSNHDGLEGTGGVAWTAAPALCSLLALPLALPSSSLVSGFRGVDFSNKVVVELGSGTGAVGLFIAARWPSAKVVLTDLAEAQEQLRYNIAVNGLGGRCVAAELPFGESVPRCLARVADTSAGSLLQLEPGRRADVIIVSDCTYSYLAEFVWQPLAQTILSGLEREEDEATVRSGPVSSTPRRPTEVWIAHQERHGARGPKLQEFLAHLAEAVTAARGFDGGSGGLSPSFAGGPKAGTKAEQVRTAGHFAEMRHACLSDKDSHGEYPLRVFHLGMP
mmetsp:Transcript_74873/g.150573  ORF Transcript_74873/g.150573 Transcript_74873/m.150573 type:complete len:366 (-) Transcript_74873:159-1256(-)